MSYDKKFRKKVVEFIKEGNSYRKTAKTYNVCLESIWKWVNKDNGGKGSLEDAPRKRTAYKIDREKLRNYVSEHPDAYIKEIAEEFGCSESGINYELAKLLITRKKRLNHTKNEMKKSAQNLSKI